MATCPALVLLLAVAGPAGASTQFATVRVQVIDVGQGDGILVRSPNQRWVLIDGGTSPMIADSLGPQFGVDRLALVIVSHRHGDHYGGVPAVLRQYPVERFVGNLADCPNRMTDNTIRGLLTSKGIPAQSLGADTLEIDGVRLIILPPDPTSDACPARENDNSILVRLEYGAFSMLFTGDAEVAERGWLVANHRALLDADVLKASHHGSDNGVLDAADDPGLWLGAVSPRHVVISAGVRADYGHPMSNAVAAYTAATGGRVHCTNRHQTTTIYGYRDGRVTVRHRLANTRSCAYDGTHY